MSQTVKSMNNSLKGYINEAIGISTKCKLKLIKIVEKHFFVDLPNENYLNIDIVIQENGNIKMRDVEYQTNTPVKSHEELEERFNNFEQEIKVLLDKNEVNLKTITIKKERNNLIWVIILSLAIMVISFHAIRLLLSGNYYSLLWLVFLIGYYVVPATGNSIRNRYIKAYNYLKRIIYKNKK